MAVPKKKTSPSRQGMRRAHKKVAIDALVGCKTCGEWRRPHHMCHHCGHYNGRQILIPKAQRRAEKAARDSAE